MTHRQAEAKRARRRKRLARRASTSSPPVFMRGVKLRYHFARQHASNQPSPARPRLSARQWSGIIRGKSKR